MPYGVAQCYLPPGRGDIAPLLVLDLATREGCNAELTYLVPFCCLAVYVGWRRGVAVASLGVKLLCTFV